MMPALQRGTTLIETLVGLAVASLVATIALVSLSIAGIAAARHGARIRSDDAAWMALAAMARDLDAADRWTGCNGSIACADAPSHRGPAALVLRIDEKRVAWFSERGALIRCEKECGTYLAGVSRAAFLADIPQPAGGVRRTWLAEAHENNATAIDVSLTMANGRTYSRTTGRRHAR